jgi:hypothetical protein
MRRTADEEAVVSQAIQQIREFIAMELADLPNDIQSIVLKRLPDDLALKPLWRGPVTARRRARLGLSDDAFLRVAKDMDEDTEELELGIETESEHAGTYQRIKDYYEENGKWPDAEKVYEWIASDHLAELPTYYSDVLIPAEESAKKSS